MSRCLLIAELATNHGGDLALATEMITTAANAGADIVKTQGYQIAHLKRSDPQYDWMRQCELVEADHVMLKAHAERCGVEYLSTAYRVGDLSLLKRAGLTAVKIGSGEGLRFMQPAIDAGFTRIYVSLPWGRPAQPFLGVNRGDGEAAAVTVFSTVPLYPMPPECFSHCVKHEAWSDHAIGIDVAKMAIARGATHVEKHFHLVGKGCREQPWNMTPEELSELVLWSKLCAQAIDGTKYEGRWQHA